MPANPGQILERISIVDFPDFVGHFLALEVIHHSNCADQTEGVVFDVLVHVGLNHIHDGVQHAGVLAIRQDYEPEVAENLGGDFQNTDSLFAGTLVLEAADDDGHDLGEVNDDALGVVETQLFNGFEDTNVDHGGQIVDVY